MSFFRKSGIVNVKMVITEEKIISNIDKIQKLINPKNKKQIVQLDEDNYFRDLVESVKTYLMEYPKKKNFPTDVYKSAYELVEFATNQFEENTRKVEDCIRQREINIKLANVLTDVLKATKAKSKNWREIVKRIKKKYPENIIEALNTIGNSEEVTEEVENAEHLVLTKVNNLESNMFIEIDIERIEDRSKALSYIGIEIAEALKYIPAPVQTVTEETTVQTVEETTTTTELAETTKPTSELLQDIIKETEETPQEELNEVNNFIEETRFEAKPTLWQRIKNSKFVKTIKYIMQIKVVLELPALPEGRGE